MTSKDRLPGLRASVPALEPDPVLLAQLTALSSASARPARRAGGRIAVVTVGAVAIGSVSWLAGAVPGTRSPLEPATRNSPAPSVSSSTGAAASSGSATPDAPVPTAGASGAGSVPSAIDPTDVAPTEPGAAGATSAGSQPANDGPGRGDGDGNGHGQGKALGHLNPQHGGPGTGAEKSAEKSQRGVKPGTTKKTTRKTKATKKTAPQQNDRVPADQGQGETLGDGAGTGP